MRKKMTYNRILSSLTLLAALCVLSRGQLEIVDMQSATQQLARRFEEVRTVGLGIDSLQVGRGICMLETTIVVPLCFDLRLPISIIKEASNRSTSDKLFAGGFVKVISGCSEIPGVCIACGCWFACWSLFIAC